MSEPQSEDAIEAAWRATVLEVIQSLMPDEYEQLARSAAESGVSIENLLLGALRSRGFFGVRVQPAKAKPAAKKKPGGGKK